MSAANSKPDGKRCAEVAVKFNDPKAFPDARRNSDNSVPETFKLYYSLQVIPAEAVSTVKVGLGRSEPNNHPVLPPPSGRLDPRTWVNPYRAVYDLCGPKAVRTAVIITVVVLVGLTIVVLGTPLIWFVELLEGLVHLFQGRSSEHAEV